MPSRGFFHFFLPAVLAPRSRRVSRRELASGHRAAPMACSTRFMGQALVSEARSSRVGRLSAAGAWAGGGSAGHLTAPRTPDRLGGTLTCYGLAGHQYASRPA